MPTAKQKKQFRKITTVIVSLVLIATFGFILYQWVFSPKTKFVRYPEFGIAMPVNYAIHGIDVSKYQQTIDWDEVKAMQVKNIKLSFSFIKATEGLKNEDPQFSRNWKKTKQTGIHRGAYHFFIASKDGASQAQNFINTVKLEPGDMPPVLDVEQLNGTGPSQLQTEVKEWLSIVEAHYGVKPIIYTNVDFYIRNLGSDFDNYPLWAAHYYRQKEPRINRSWLFWQHSDAGRVNGIISKVDFNVFNGNWYDFQRLLIR